MFQRLNGKKGLIAIALIISVMLGAYIGGYYTWTVHYEINPLTHDETITLPKTTGATIGKFVVGKETIEVDKPIKMWFRVDKADTDILAAHYWYLVFSVKIIDYRDGIVADFLLPLVVDGVGQGEVVRFIPLDNINPTPKEPDYEVIKDVDYWTGAVEVEVGGSFTVYIWAEEV